MRRDDTTASSAGVSTRGWQSSLMLGAVLAVSVMAFHLITVRAGHNWAGDFALYILHAKNVVEGRPYAETGYIENTFFPFLSPPTYPPVFPLMLAPVYAMAGMNLTLMKAVCIICFGASLFTIFIAFGQRLSTTRRAALVLILGYNPYFWDFKDQILSDLPFLMLTCLGLVLIDRSSRQRQDVSQWLNGALTGFVMFLACSTRTVGVIAVASLLVHRLVITRKIDCFAGAAIGTVALGSIVESLTLQRDSNYLMQMGVYLNNPRLLLVVPLRALRGWGTSLALIWDNGFSLPLTLAIAVAVGVLACAGYVLTIRRRGWTIFEVFALGYPVGLIFWPLAAYTRFLIPILPLYVAYAVMGWDQLATKLRVSVARLGGGLVLVLVLATYAAKYTTLDFGPIGGIQSAPAQGLFEYVRTRTSASDDVFIFAKPRVLALMTGQSAAVYHVAARDFRIADQSLWKFMEEIGATYIVNSIWWKQDQYWLENFVRRHEHRFELVYKNSDHKVYRILRPTR